MKNYTVKITIDGTGEVFVMTAQADGYDSAIEQIVNALVDDPAIDASENDVFSNELVEVCDKCHTPKTCSGHVAATLLVVVYIAVFMVLILSGSITNTRSIHSIPVHQERILAANK